MTAFSSSLLETFVPELASLNPVSRYWAKLRRGISDFQISSQSLIKENCHNSRIRDDIDMNLNQKLNLLTLAKLKVPWYQKVYFLKLHMFGCLHTKFQNSSLILTSFRQRKAILYFKNHIL